MRQNLKSTLAIFAIFALIVCFAACNKIDAEGLWESATYLKDTKVGEGSKEISVSVEIEEQAVLLTVKTDAQTLGEALYDEGIINDAVFFDTANGIKADWNADQAYWAIWQGDEYMMVGASEINISGGESYRLVYTKG